MGNALGNGIVSGLSSAPKSANTATTSPKRSGQTQPVGTTSGTPASQGAVDINPENALERWNRLEAAGGLDSLSDDAYYSLATAANSIENATRPITSFDRFNRLVNHSNMIRQQLNSDLATKAQSVQRTQSLIANNQAWIDRNTTSMGRVPQAFDLESSLIGSIDWQDMSQPLTPGPWRDGYVMPLSNETKPQVQSEFGKLINDTSSRLNAAGLGVYSLEAMAKKGWGSTLGKGQTLTGGIVGSYFDRIYDPSKSTVVFDYSIDTQKTAPLVNDFGQGLGLLSLGLSGGGAYYSYATDADGWDFGDGFRELGKVGVDLAAAAPSLLSKEAI
nr:hypothetical protein [Ningiella sp. W23]